MPVGLRKEMLLPPVRSCDNLLCRVYSDPWDFHQTGNRFLMGVQFPRNALLQGGHLRFDQIQTLQIQGQ
jgi:hypothetical protein